MIEEIVLRATDRSHGARKAVAFAKTEGGDHIVAGSASRRGLVGALIGSVARDVVAHCPATVVR